MSRFHSPFLLLLLSALFLSGTVGAQHARPRLPQHLRSDSGPAAQRSVIQESTLFSTVDHTLPRTVWQNKVTRVEARDHSLPEVRAIKEAKWEQKVQEVSKARQAPGAGAPKAITPVVGSNFEGNWSVQQTPPDNSVAISNGGWIVSANNDGVIYADPSGNISYSSGWSDFFNNPQLNANIYDPKVLYDSGSDRYFMTVLHGSTASNSLLLLCFSKSNDPNGGWWTYSLPGSPLMNNTWFDYPSIGVSNNEVYVSGNLFTSGGNQFDQAILFQIQKAQGYAGQGLNWVYWTGFTNSPFGAFTIVPASYGQQGNYGPGIILVSSSAGGAGSVRLYDLTDDLTGSPQIDDYVVNVANYSPAANAVMQGNGDQLDNGDCRVLGAFYLGNLLHVVHHGDVGGTWNGILYKRINVNDLTVQQSTFGEVGVSDVSYPAMSSYATSASDPSVMIAFLQSSQSIYPQLRVVNCDANMTWSTSTLVKNGETFVNFINGTERWGDYTGMARRHNASSPDVWLAGCYGANVSGIMNNTWKTWIAQVGGSSVGIAAPMADAQSVSVYPVPIADLFTLEFPVSERTEHTVAIHDVRGALVKVLYRDTPAMGLHRLTFNREQLASGIYVLTITANGRTIAHEDLVVH